MKIVNVGGTDNTDLTFNIADRLTRCKTTKTTPTA
jgi:hypothetical protein